MEKVFSLWDSDEQKPIQVYGKKNGQEWKAVCPKHADTNPSLSINEAKGLFKCFGCQFKGGLYNASKTTATGKLIATYDYADENGNLLFQVCKHEGKIFKARRPDGNGGYQPGIDGVRRVPYRLSELIKSETVCWVEGCKDAENLRILGFTATTTPFGSGAYRPEYAEYFRGKDVYCFSDNDAPGRAYVEQVIASLNGIAKSVKWIDLPGLEEKQDVTDFILKYSDPEEAKKEISRLIEQAPLYKAPQKKTIEDIILTVQDFHNLQFPRRAYFLHPWLMEQQIILITGERGVGKSFAVHGILRAISQARNFGPWEFKGSAPILIIDGEMAATDDQERFEMMGLNETGLSPVYVYSDAWANQCGISRAHLANEEWRETVKQIILNRHIKIVVIDNLASLAYGIDENTKQDWDSINQWLIDLRFLGVTTILEHHTGNSGRQRGTSAREDNIDISIMLKKPADYVPEDGCRFIMSFSKARVNQDALSLIGDTEFQLTKVEGGKYEFSTKNVRRAVKEEITRMLGEGKKQKEIVDTLHVDKAYVSRIARGIKG